MSDRVVPDTSSITQARKVGFALLVIVVGLVAGAASVKVQPLLVIGAFLAPLAVFAVLRWPYAGLLLYLLIYFTQIADQYPELKPLRLERLIGVATLGSMFLQQLRNEKAIYIDRSKVTLWLFGIVLAVVNSIPLSYWPGRSVTGLVEYFKVVVFYLLVVQLINDRKRLRVFLLLYLACMVYLASDGLINYVTGNVNTNYAPGMGRLTGSTDVAGGPNGMAATMAACFPIYALLMGCRQIGRWRFVFLGAMVLSVVVLILTGSRSGLIGFSVGALLVLWYSGRRWLNLAIAVPLIFLIWSAMPAELQNRFATLKNATEQSTAGSRIELWIKGVHMLMDHPLTGVGMNAYRVANSEYSESTGLDKEPWHDSHSLYVQVGAQLGIPGMIAFTLYVVSFTGLLRRTTAGMKDDDEWAFERAFLRGALFASVALLAAGMMGHNLMRRQWYIFGALAVAAWRIHGPMAQATARSATARLSARR